MTLNLLQPMRLDPAERDTLFPVIDLGEVLRGAAAKLLRRWPLVAGFVALSIALSVAYVVTATPIYTATGSLLIDPRSGRTPNDASEMIPGLLLSDALTVDSELRVLVAREVTTNTVRALGLKATPETGRSWTQIILGWFGAGGPGTSAVPASAELLAERQTEALRREFVRSLDVQRAGDSFVIDIAFTSPDYGFAALAVNTLMSEYLRLSAENHMASAERTRAWLSDRIGGLAQEVQAAETAIAAYRQDNRLLAPEGALLPAEIALNATTEELVRLRVQAISLDVQIRQLADQIAADRIDAVQVPPDERTQALAEFEARHAELLQSEQDLLLSWDENSPVVAGVRQQKEQTRALILKEFRQVLDRLGARRDSLGLQVAAAESVIADLREQYGADTGNTVRLRALEREAEAKRVLYERLLEDYNSTSQLLTFDATSARVIAWAVAPDKKSGPKSRQIVILAAFAGLVLAVGTVFLLDSLDNSFRTQADLTRSLGLPFLGVIPSFGSDRGHGQTRDMLGRASRNDRWKTLSSVARKFDFSVLRPSSVTAETMRALHVRLVLQDLASASRGIYVGVVSSVRDEGKTTTAFNLAAYLASQNEKVVLVDLDLISREMSRQIGAVLPESNSLQSLLDDPASAMAGLTAIPEFPGLMIIGNPGRGDVRLSASRDTRILDATLGRLHQHFDYVIVDLPPFQGAADTQLLARLCDRLIYVVRWGRTPREQVISALRKSGLPREKILGTLFTQASLRKYRSYNRHEVTDYYS